MRPLILLLAAADQADCSAGSCPAEEAVDETSWVNLLQLRSRFNLARMAERTLEETTAPKKDGKAFVNPFTRRRAPAQDVGVAETDPALEDPGLEDEMKDTTEHGVKPEQDPVFDAPAEADESDKEEMEEPTPAPTPKPAPKPEEAAAAAASGEEFCRKYEISVGSSSAHSKNVNTMLYPGETLNCPERVDKTNWKGGQNYGDWFECKLEGATAVVTRKDKKSGWGMDLVFDCDACGGDPEQGKPKTIPGAAPFTQGPGIDWVGINAGYGDSYTDSKGRKWLSTNTMWSEGNTGGFVGSKPKPYSNGWKNGDRTPRKCHNRPPQFGGDADYTKLFQNEAHDGNTIKVRFNMQSADKPVSYYKVSWAFCEKYGYGGDMDDLVLQGKVMKYDYMSKLHHSHLDHYEWQCVPTVDGKIEMEMVGAGSSRSARFSVLMAEKSMEGCDEVYNLDCSGEGWPGTGQVDDYAGPGLENVANMYDASKYIKIEPKCFCDRDVTDPTCAGGDACSTIDCGEYGECGRGICACKYGYTGKFCDTPPDPCDVGECELCQPSLCTTDWAKVTDCGSHGSVDPVDKRLCVCRDDYSGKNCEVAPKRGCTSHTAPNYDSSANVDDGSCQVRTLPTKSKAGLKVGAVTLPVNIAGKHHTGSCSSVHNIEVISDRSNKDLVYIGFTEDREWGTATEQGAVHVAKVSLGDALKGGAKVASTKFEGFAQNGAIAISPFGHVGVMCAKFIKGWMEEPGWYRKMMQCPKHMQKFKDGGSCPSFTGYENQAWDWHDYKKYPHALAVCEVDTETMQPFGRPWMLGPSYVKTNGGTDDKSQFTNRPQGSPGIGQLYYDDSAHRWSGLWGCYWVDHSASCLFSKEDDFSKDNWEPTKKGASGEIKMTGVSERPNTHNTKDWNMCGGHESRVIQRYNPATQSVGIMCQNEKSDYHWKIQAGGNRQVIGNRYWYGGAARPCCDGKGKGWVAAFYDENKKAGCTRIIDKGNKHDVQLDNSPPGSRSKALSDQEVRRDSVKIATLAGDERAAACHRFLVGWITTDNRHQLVEIDGQCNKVSAIQDVSGITDWDGKSEWTTTADGRVVWTSAWAENGSGSPNLQCKYGGKPQKGRKDGWGKLGYDGYGMTSGFVTNEVKVSIYESSAAFKQGTCSIPAPAGSKPSAR